MNRLFMHYLSSVLLYLILSRLSVFSLILRLHWLSYHNFQQCIFPLKFLNLNLKSCFCLFQSFRQLLTPSICLLHQHHLIQLFLHVKLNCRNFILIWSISCNPRHLLWLFVQKLDLKSREFKNSQNFNRYFPQTAPIIVTKIFTVISSIFSEVSPAKL